MGLEEQVTRTRPRTYLKKWKAQRPLTICKHAFSDLRHVSPFVFIYLLKECYFKGMVIQTPPPPSFTDFIVFKDIMYLLLCIELQLAHFSDALVAKSEHCVLLLFIDLSVGRTCFVGSYPILDSWIL